MNILLHGREQCFGLFDRLAGENHQELASAAGAEQNLGEAQLRQQRTRDHFAEQRHPPRAGHGENLFSDTNPVGRSAGGRRNKKTLYVQKFSLKKDLYGHPD